MKSRILALAALALLAASVANAGILRFAAKHTVKPAAHATKKVAKAALKVVF